MADIVMSLAQQRLLSHDSYLTVTKHRSLQPQGPHAYARREKKWQEWFDIDTAFERLLQLEVVERTVNEMVYIREVSTLLCFPLHHQHQQYITHYHHHFAILLHSSNGPQRHQEIQGSCRQR